MESDQQIFLVAQREINVPLPGEKDLYAVGTISVIRQILRISENSVRVMMEGRSRARLRRLWQTEPYLQGNVEPMKELKSRITDFQLEALLRQTYTNFGEYAALATRMSEDITAAVMDDKDPGHLADFIAQNIVLRHEDRQMILEEERPVPRLRKVNELLARETEVLGYEQELEGKIRQQMGEVQKDHIIREQIRLLQRELGEDEDSEINDYRRKIQERKLGEEIETKLLKEVDRLAKQPFGSAEGAVIRNYLDVCLDMPWGVETKERASVAAARKILDHDHYGLEKVKERILEILAVRQLNTEVKGQIVCLVGPPGVGKTSIARSVAACMGRNFARMSLGGVHDEAEIRGHRRTYIGAMPGRIISAINTAKSSNPVILLDEIDKLAGDYRGDPSSALLEVLDPEQNKTFKDNYLDIPFDLSNVLFITTANDASHIPGPLYDRMDVIELPSYTRVEKFNIARRHLLPKQLKNNGLESRVTMAPAALYEIIDGYTREAGVRTLERTITAVLRKCAQKIAAGEKDKINVTPAMVKAMLGPEKVKPTFISRTDAVGIANGLAWTSVGGEMLPIEVSIIPNGSGKVEITGSLGDVMKESAHLALTYARVHAETYHIAPDKFKNTDIHIHAPEGAVPKDGPSAGVTLTTALISALSEIPVRHDLAMTGEITLHGNVLPIGGLKEKSMAAFREGISTVLIPEANKPDLYEVDEEVKKAVKFIPVSDLSQVLKHALILPAASAAHKRTMPQATQLIATEQSTAKEPAAVM